MTESTSFPLVPAPFTGHSRQVDAGACFEWLQQGWLLFLVNPGVWIGATVALLLILAAITVAPVLGQVAANLLLPLLGAGMFQIAHRLANGEEAQIADLFVGFRRNAGPLVMVGVIYAAGAFGLAILGFLLVTGGVVGGAVTGSVAGIGISIGVAMLAAVLVLVLSAPIVMAVWFAPALVLFHGMAPGAAMRASLAACARNWAALTIFSIFLTVALFFALLLLGLGLLLLLPIFSGAVYASYRDIFEAA